MSRYDDMTREELIMHLEKKKERLIVAGQTIERLERIRGTASHNTNMVRIKQLEEEVRYYKSFHPKHRKVCANKLSHKTLESAKKKTQKFGGYVYLCPVCKLYHHSTKQKPLAESDKID